MKEGGDYSSKNIPGFLGVKQNGLSRGKIAKDVKRISVIIMGAHAAAYSNSVNIFLKGLFMKI